MLISAALTSKDAAAARLQPRGFTLLEMLVVLMVLALIAGFSVPLFQNLIQGQVQRESTRLSRVIRVLRNEAVLTQTDYRLMVDLKEQSYWVEARSGDKYQPRTDVQMLRKYVLPASFHLTDLVVMGSTHSKNSEERPVPIYVDATGFTDPFMLHFTVDNVDYTFKVAGFRASVDLLTGYVRE